MNTGQQKPSPPPPDPHPKTTFWVSVLQGLLAIFGRPK